MALQKTLIEIPAIGGLNQELEKWTPAPYTILENLQATKTGAVEKRRGFRRMPKSVIALPARAAGVNIWDTLYGVSSSPSGELFAIGNIPEPIPFSLSEKGPYLWSYSQAASSWVPKTVLPGTVVRRRPGIRGEVSLPESPPHAARIGDNYEAVLYRINSDAYIRVVDLKSNAVIGNNKRLLNALGTGVAGKAVLLHINDGLFTTVYLNTARTQLRFGTINPSTLTTGAWNVTTFSGTIAFWDVVPGAPGEFIFAALVPGSPTGSIHLLRVSAASFSVLASTVELVNTGASVCGVAYSPSRVAMIWNTPSGVLYRQYDATTLTPLAAVGTFLPTSTFLAGIPTQVAVGYETTGRLSLLACGPSSTHGYPATWRAAVTPNHSMGNVAKIPWCFLQSKPFLILNEQYVLVGKPYEPQFKATLEFGYAMVHLGRHVDSTSDNRPFSLEGLLAPYDSVCPSPDEHLPLPAGPQGRAVVALHVAGNGARTSDVKPRVWADVFELSSPSNYRNDQLWRSAYVSKLTHLATSLTGQFDGQTFCEISFLQPPQLAVGRPVNPVLTYGTVGPGGTTSNPGNYKYLAHWEWLDAQGNLHRSRLSDPISVTVAATLPNNAAKVGLYLTTTGLTRRGNIDESEGSRPRIALYRTLNNGTVYYRCKPFDSALNLPESQWDLFLEDDENDAQLLAAGRGVIYTDGGILESETVPCARHLQVAGGRVWLTSSESPEVWPSKIILNGEAPSFSSSLRISMDDAQTPLVGTGWLNGTIIIFSENRIYALPAASGPSDSGEGAWPKPEEIQSSSGCVSPASIVSYADGVFYRDKDGFKLLTRGYDVVPIGDAVRDCTDLLLDTLDVVLDEANSRILALVSAPPGGQTYQGNHSVLLVWDYGHRVWSIWTLGAGWTNGRLTLWKNDPVVVRANEVLRMDTTGTGSSLAFDNFSVVPGDQWIYSTLATPWITNRDQFGREAPLGGFFRVWRAVVEMERRGAHGLKISVYSDGEETTPTQIETWSSAQINALHGLPRERIVLGIANQKCMAIKIKIEDQPPPVFGHDQDTGFRYYRTTLEVGTKVGVEKAEKANTR